jgi:hypothetical protein
MTRRFYLTGEADLVAQVADRLANRLNAKRLPDTGNRMRIRGYSRVLLGSERISLPSRPISHRRTATTFHPRTSPAFESFGKLIPLFIPSAKLSVPRR